MSNGTSKSLSDIIASSDGALSGLAREARLREDLSTYLRKHLPEPLTGGFLHCNLRDEGLLVVLATSPEWASRLRFEADRIRQICADQGTEVTSVRVRVG
jgi:hypothetical protein